MTVGTISFAHTGAVVKAETGSFRMEGGDATLEVHRVPFSEAGMAERFIADPLFYRNLALFVASELRRQAVDFTQRYDAG